VTGSTTHTDERLSRTAAPTRTSHGPAGAHSPAVSVHGSDVHVERANFEVPLAEARSRYGGLDLPAALGGALAGLGTAALLGSLATAAGLQVGQADAEQVAVGGAVTAAVVLALSALVGGWVAGRVARYDGARNGLVAGLLLFLLTAALGALAAGVHEGMGLPVSLDASSLTTAAVVGALVALAVCLLGGLVGGRLGSRWHRDVDDVIVGTRPGAVALPTDGTRR
jgi:MFS family permease